MRKIILYSVLAILTALHLAPTTENDWPLSGLRIIKTQWSSWITRFFALDEKNNLVYVRVKDRGNEVYKVTRYRRNPDLVKHFPLDDGDLVVSIFNNEKIMEFVAVDFAGTVQYANEFVLGYNVYDVDARVNITAGNPSCLFYAYDRKTYSVKYWSQAKTQDIMVSREPIDLMFLQWSDGGVNYVSNSPGGLTWTFWKDGQYRSYPLPFPIRHAQFYYYRRTMHLIGIDLEGGLWQFDIASNTLHKNLLAKDRRLIYVDTVAPLTYKRELNVILSGTQIRSAYRLTFDDFPNPRRKPYLEERKLFWNGKLFPLIDGSNQLNFLLETEIHHIYMETWSAPTAIITDIDWQLNIQRNPPVMMVNWAVPAGSQYAYRYLLNQNTDSEPLADAKLIPSNMLQFSARKEGTYVLHLQVRNMRTGSFSRIYHVPIVWQYAPLEPEILLRNQIAPRMIRPGAAEFLIENLSPGLYYAEVDGRPDTIPKDVANISDGRLIVGAGTTPGKHYLHLANRDPRSQVLSPVAHYLFFTAPFDASQDPELAEMNQKLDELKKIRRKIEAAKGEPAKTQYWINRLQEIEAQLK
jgi:hypothetical protein